MPLSDFLVYDYFDEEQGLFFNNNDSIGFWYEINPLVGSNEGLEKNLTLFLNSPVHGWIDELKPLVNHQLNDFKPLMTRVESDKIKAIVDASKDDLLKA